MANPQTEDGFIQIARELWDEVIRRDFTKRQKDILFFIWRLSYGCRLKSALIPKMRNFQICGVPETKIKSELEFLERCRVLIWDRDNKIFEINKDFDRWQVSPVMGWDEEQFDSLISLNLSRKTSQKGKFQLPEKGSSEEETFPKREGEVSRNGKVMFPETGNSTPDEPNQDKASESPKDSIKDSIKDSSSSKVLQLYTGIESSSSRGNNDFSFGRIYQIYVEHFTDNGKMTELEREDLIDQFETYGGEWLLEAMREAVRAKKKTLSYINGVLKGFRQRGGPHVDTARGSPESEKPNPMLDDDDPIMRMMREEDRRALGTAAH